MWEHQWADGGHPTLKGLIRPTLPRRATRRAYEPILILRDRRLSMNMLTNGGDRTVLRHCMMRKNQQDFDGKLKAATPRILPPRFSHHPQQRQGVDCALCYTPHLLPLCLDK